MEAVFTNVVQSAGALVAPAPGRECKETLAYLFGPFRFIPARRTLLREDVPQRIGGRAIDILAVLLEHAGEPVSKRELMERVWPTTVVEDGNLKVNVAALRNALGGFASGSRYIGTVNGRGYCFVGSVQAGAGLEPASSKPVRDNPAHPDTQQLLESLHAQREQVCALQHAVEVLQRERDRDRMALESMRDQLEVAIHRSAPKAHLRSTGSRQASSRQPACACS